MRYLIVVLVTCLGFTACKQSPQTQTASIQFETMGTFGTVKIVSDSLDINQEQIAKDIDSIFIDFNMSLSTYIDSSYISRLNNGEILNANGDFEYVNLAAQHFYKKTNGAFNPSGKALFEYWHFLDGKVDSIFVDSLKRNLQDYMVFHPTFRIDPVTKIKEDLDVSKYRKVLDFSAIAKGYGVDVIAEYLSNLGYTNYMVEIGGEVVCRGVNATGDAWRLGIEEPNEEVRAIYEVVALKDKAMATSGNYRNFKVLENGQKVVHIINPKTGYPEISNLLSASIIADDCMSADAYATACMVMGVDTCFDFVLNHKDLECYLIYSDEEGDLQVKFTEGFGEVIVE